MAEALCLERDRAIASDDRGIADRLIERRAARENFKGLKQLPPEQRKELPNKWMEYQSLPQEEQQALRRSAAAQRNAAGPDAAPPPRQAPATSLPPASPPR